jgi:hypothetical protein
MASLLESCALFAILSLLAAARALAGWCERAATVGLASSDA